MSICRRRLSLGLVQWGVMWGAVCGAGFGADDKPRFAAQPAAAYATKQTISGITVAAVPYGTEDLAKSAFGKVNPNEHGVLPVLVVVQIDSKQAIRLTQLAVEYIGRNRARLENTPAADLPYLKGPRRPNMSSSPIPRIGSGKNKLAASEFQTRAFSAKMLPPGESAHGFFYFQTEYRPGDQLYLTGLQEAASGKELFYFEIPLE